MDNDIEMYENEIDLRELIKLVWDNKKLIFSVMIAALLVVFLYFQFFYTEIFKTESLIQLSNVGGVYSEPLSSMNYIKNTDLVHNILNELNQDYSLQGTRNFLDRNITVSNIEGTDILKLELKYKDPVIAKNVLVMTINDFKKSSQDYYNQIINNKNEYLDKLNSEEKVLDTEIKYISSQIDNYDSNNLNTAENSILYNNMISKLESLRIQKENMMVRKQNLKEEILSYYPVKVINEPYYPEMPVDNQLMLKLAIAVILALMTSVFYIFFREFMKEGEVETEKEYNKEYNKELKKERDNIRAPESVFKIESKK